MTCASCGAELPAGARFCPSCAAPVEAAEPAAAGGERKVATVVFADLVGSTALGGSQDPERTRVLLDRFYDAMTDEVERAGGTIEKFAGDAVMAAFGVPAALEDHAERALHAALAMRRRTRELDGRLELRIGINTGEVVVGRPREGSSFVTGDTVNVAARLEQGAEPGEVLVGERTVESVRGAFEFDEPRTIEAKGKPGGVTCRRLVAALSLMRPRGVGGVREAFVGRDTELDLLRATYRRVVERGEPHLVTIMGDAGVGKTRLVRELWSQLEDESPEPARRTGRCLSYGRGITYWSVAEILREHFGMLENEPPERLMGRLEGREILGLVFGLDVAPDLHPLVAREQLQEATARFLEEVASTRPLVLLVEDLHWAEEDLLDLVDRLLSDVNGPLLLIATARPEVLDQRPAWGGGKRNVTLLGLDPLTERQTEEMVAQLLASELPDAVRRALVERAGGNPFFVEELVATFIDRGVLERSNGGWTARELPEGFEIPDSVQAVLAARIDLLPATEKAALQAASVIGRTFWAGPVGELLGGEDPDYVLLEDRDFIRRRPGASLEGEREFVIKHALTREVAYGTLPKARRAKLHAAFAGWLESSVEAREEQAALLGHHYAEAVRPEDADLAWEGEDAELERLRAKAVEWLEHAGRLATGRYELDDAVALLHRGLELEDDRGRKATLWHALGRAYALKYDGKKFWDAMQQAIACCDDEAVQAELYADLAMDTALRAGMFTTLPAAEVVDDWIDRALALSAPESRSVAKALIARAHWHRSRALSSGEAESVEAMEAAETLDDPDLRVIGRQEQSISLFAQGKLAEATTWADRAYELADEVRDPDIAADLHFVAALPAAGLGEFERARSCVRRYEEANVTLTPHHRLHGVAVAVEVEEIAGNWTGIRALERLVRERVNANLATPCMRNTRSLLLCTIAAELDGDSERAAELETFARRVEHEGFERSLFAPELRLALVRGDLERAERLVAETTGLIGPGWFGLVGGVASFDALARLQRREDVERLAEEIRPGTLLEAVGLRALGQVREDETPIRQALERFEAMGLDWYASETRKLVAQS